MAGREYATPGRRHLCLEKAESCGKGSSPSSSSGQPSDCCGFMTTTAFAFARPLGSELAGHLLAWRAPPNCGLDELPRGQIRGAERTSAT